MKKFIETIKNIWAIEDLRSRILVTLLFATIYRFGSFIVLPGIDPNVAQASLENQASGNGLLNLLSMFSGGAFTHASIFALGIMPYISASIVIQLLCVAVPSFQKIQREGESGRRKINQYTRALTLLILLVQGPAYLINLRSQMGDAMPTLNWTMFLVTSTIILAAGSMFILWLGERITDKGIGNGVSLIIMLGIIARLPMAFGQELTTRFTNMNGGGLVMFLIEIIVLFAVVIVAILLVQGTRKVPVQYAKRVVGNQAVGGARQYIPLKVFAANVMPIIFAQALMFIPGILARAIGGDASSAAIALSNPQGLWYNILSAILIIAFTYFYTAITLNPVQMAEDMKRNNGFIPGVRPGKDTAEYIDGVMSRITFPGSLILAFIAIMPVFAGMFNVTREFAAFFGGTSLLILVGVVLDTLQQIESHLLMRHYDGLLSSGRIHGRAGVNAY
ncbi:MAG: preprotein translocase subunit SecY [Bacteroidaceae bacterium]|nr:preprotein translocase subunit SecY [Bacteroidaceae bacterium]